MPRWLRWTIAVVVAVAVVVVGGAFVYTRFINDPEDKLTFEARDEELAAASSTTPAPTTTGQGDNAAGTSTPTTAGPAADGITGTWAPTPESEVGYRVKEVLFGQSTEGVGRTNAVTGQLVIDGTTVQSADLEVDLTTLQSDQDRRDSQVQDRLLDTASFPTATLTLTQPIELGQLPADRQEIEAQATAELTLRGTTKELTFPVLARRNGELIEVNGTIEIVFADWGIPDPSIGPVTTEDRGQLEFLVVFAREG